MLDAPVAIDIVSEEAFAASTTSPPVVDPSDSFVLDARQVDRSRFATSLRILEALHDLLLSNDADKNLQKFSKIISTLKYKRLSVLLLTLFAFAATKWMLLFVYDRHGSPLAAVLALRILVRLLQTQGSAFVAKFSNSTDGFIVLRAAVPHFWNFAQIHLALFALLHDHDITTISLDATFSPSTFLHTAVDRAACSADAARVVIACLNKGLKVLEKADEADAATGEPATGTLTFSKGFAMVLELISQANRAIGGGNQLATSATALPDLVIALRPSLRLPSSPEYPPSAAVPFLPILSSRNGYDPSARPPIVLVDLEGPLPSSSSHDLLKLQILTGKAPSSPLASPLSALDDGVDTLPSRLVQVGKLGGSATALLQFLSQQVSHQITTRHAKRRSLSGIELSLPPSADPSLQTFRDLLDAAASTDLHDQVRLSGPVLPLRAALIFTSQVVFRTLLIKDILRRLTRASTAPLIAERIASFVETVTELAFQGQLTRIP